MHLRARLPNRSSLALVSYQCMLPLLLRPPICCVAEGSPSQSALQDSQGRGPNPWCRSGWFRSAHCSASLPRCLAGEATPRMPSCQACSPTARRRKAACQALMRHRVSSWSPNAEECTKAVAWWSETSSGERARLRQELKGCNVHQLARRREAWMPAFGWQPGSQSRWRLQLLTPQLELVQPIEQPLEQPSQHQADAAEQ